MQYLLASLDYIWKQLWPILNPDQALSWRIFLFLCLFSWFLALLTSDDSWLLERWISRSDTSSALFFHMSAARWLLFTLGWVSLCLSMAWLLVKSVIVVPFFAIQIYPAAWVVGFLTSTYFFVMGTGDVRVAAVVGWPLVSAAYTLLPKIISSSTGRFSYPNSEVRQQFTILFLASATVSCWFQFQVMVQGWVTDYPVLLLGPIEDSAFVIPVGDRPPVFDVAEATIDQTLQLRSIPQARLWIQRSEQFSDAVNTRFQSKLETARNQLLEDLWDDVKGESPESSESAPTPPRPETALEPERWRMTVVPDTEDPSGLGLQLQLRSRPLSGRAARREASVTYPCTVRPYTPPENRISRPIPPSDPGETDENGTVTGAPSADTENVDDYRQSRVICRDEPSFQVLRALVVN